jgi:hypothetical protein
MFSRKVDRTLSYSSSSWFAEKDPITIPYRFTERKKDTWMDGWMVEAKLKITLTRIPKSLARSNQITGVSNGYQISHRPARVSSVSLPT